MKRPDKKPWLINEGYNLHNHNIDLNKYIDYLELGRKTGLKLTRIFDNFFKRLDYKREFENGSYHTNEVSVNEANVYLK